MKVFGLIGYPLTHSFSKKYFTEKFEKLGLEGYSYELFPLEKIEDIPQLIADNPNLVGLNVTIPYKESVVPFLSELDETVKVIGAVNTIKILKGSPPNVGGVPRSGEGVQLIGYNTDVIGFSQSLKPLLHPHHERALILGTGGAAKAVAHVLKGLGIQYYFVSREKKNGTNCLTYSELNEGVFNACKLIVNTTPVGMYPAIEAAPALPYQFFTPQHLAYDLIYNPTDTRFMQQAAQQGAHMVNGLNMLYSQAEAAWKIWNKD
jgi:shikimate dehydrogenase